MIDIEKIQAKHIIFDLDGTLIDSAPAILDSFAKAFDACGRTPLVPLVPTLTGPPLMQILTQLAGTDSNEVLNPLFEAFKAHYDEAGYLQTTMFPGISETLEELRRRGHVLYLATNKRIVPTQKIIEYFGWQDHFVGIYALDCYVPALKTKAELLGCIVEERGLDVTETLYVGDRDEDGKVAVANRLGFLMVGWGYAE